MKDTIYRQDAIDALEKVAELYQWRVPGDRDSYSQYNEAWQDALNRADSEIEALPSAQPDITDEQAIEHLKASGWMQNHDREMYEMGLKERLADDSDSYDALLSSAQPERKTGKLIYESAYNWFRCNVCRKIYPSEFMQYFDSCQYQPRLNFCPNCGCDMRGEEDG